MKGKLVLMGVFLGVVLIATYSQHAVPALATAAQGNSVTPTGAVKEINLGINIRGFSPTNPATWTVTEGDTVRLIITSLPDEYAKGVEKGAKRHTFNIDEYGIHLEIPPGSSKLVEFFADGRAKRVTFYDDTLKYQGQGVIEIRAPAVEPTGVIRVVPLNVNIKGFSMPSYQYFHATSNAVYVNQGDTVRFVVTSVTDEYSKGVEKGAKEHGFDINEYDIHKKVPAGGTITVEFLADKKGIFTFYDSLNKIQGQGVLIVR
jgi:plastocyanin